MSSDIPNYPAKRTGDVSPAKWPSFFRDVIAGMTDLQLAAKYRLRERTATNWRVRAEKLTKQNPQRPDTATGGTTQPEVEDVATSANKYTPPASVMPNASANTKEVA